MSAASTLGPAAKLSGPRKAAVLLLLLGEEVAALICQNLGEEEVQLITAELTTLDAIPPETAEKILEEYYALDLTRDYLLQGGLNFATRLLTKAFGEEQAKNLVFRVQQAQALSATQPASLNAADPQQLAKFLEGEHPQTIALILAHLDGRQASALVMRLPEEVRAAVIMRLARLRQFSPEMVEKVSAVLNRRIESVGELSRRTYTGFRSVAELMNRIDPLTAKSILEIIEQAEPKLAINIRDLMFTFEDLLSAPEAAIREILGAVEKKTLTLALKGASQEVKNHLLKNMSSRAVEMLKEDMEALGPVRGREVSRAQQEVLALARKLEAEGKIMLKTEGEDEYVV